MTSERIVGKSANAFKNRVEQLNPLTNTSSSSLLKGLGGCKACPFLNTGECPYFPEVNDKKHHPKGYCEKYSAMVKLLGSQNYFGLTKQRQFFNMLRDQTVLDHLQNDFLKKVQEGSIKKGDTLELLEWSDHIAKNLHRIRVHEEGSKVTVQRSFKPSDVVSALKEAERSGEIINVTPEQDASSGVEFDEEDKEETQLEEMYGSLDSNEDDDLEINSVKGTGKKLGDDS